jgi:hypothetical protein
MGIRGSKKKMNFVYGEMGACMGIRRDYHMGAVARREVAACMGIRDGSRIWNKGKCLHVYL